MKHLKYFFFSDMHLCDGTEKDDFSQEHDEGFVHDQGFISRMELLQSKVDKLVGVGDIFELWQTTHDAILKAHGTLCHYLKFNAKLLKGNHDFQTFAPDTMKFVTASGLRVLVTHGHQSNPKMLKWYTRGIIYIVGKLEKWIPWLDEPDKHPKLYKLLPKKHRKVFEEKFHKASVIEMDVENYCRSFIGKYDFIICGHTHRQTVKQLFREGVKVGETGESITMLNTGHCTHNQFQGVLFDANTDRWELV